MRTFKIYTIGGTSYTVKNCYDENHAITKMYAAFDNFKLSDVFKIEEVV